MHKLKFLANTDQLNQDSRETQAYVVDLLTQKLGDFGFQTLAQSGSHVAVSVDDHALPLSVSCQTRDVDGCLVCEISSYPEETQDWLDRITERSLLSQLAQAVESSLKEQDTFKNFEWKDQS